MIKSTLHRRFQLVLRYIRNKPKTSPGYAPISMVGVIGLRRWQVYQLCLPEDPNTGIWRDHAQVSPQLAEVLDKMVSYDFSQRYQSAESASKALQGQLLCLWLSLNSLPPKRRAFLWQALIGLGISAVASVIFLWPRTLCCYDNPTWHQHQIPSNMDKKT